MKKYKSKEGVFDFLDNEIANRRLEIHYLKNILQSKRDSKESKVLIKALVVISYAHWEGFVKKASIAYLSYISFLSLNKKQISTDLFSSSLFSMMTEEGKGIGEKIKKLRGIIDDPSYKPEMNIDKMCNTESNLNNERLDKIMKNIGAPYEELRSKGMFIDGSLLNHRNKYAHGEYCEIDVDRAMEIANTTIQLMEQYKTIIDNLLALEAFRKTDDAGLRNTVRC